MSAVYLQQFPSIRTTIAKNRHFTYPGLHFLFALGTPCGNHAKRCMNEKNNSVLAKVQTPRSMHPSIFNSFPVIRTASAKNRRFHVQQSTLLFSLETPCDYHTICCMDGKTIQCLSNFLQHVPIQGRLLHINDGANAPWKK